MRGGNQIFWGVYPHFPPRILSSYHCTIFIDLLRKILIYSCNNNPVLATVPTVRNFSSRSCIDCLCAGYHAPPAGHHGHQAAPQYQAPPPQQQQQQQRQSNYKVTPVFTPQRQTAAIRIEEERVKAGIGSPMHKDGMLLKPALVRRTSDLYGSTSKASERCKARRQSTPRDSAHRDSTPRGPRGSTPRGSINPPTAAPSKVLGSPVYKQQMFRPQLVRRTSDVTKRGY